MSKEYYSARLHRLQKKFKHNGYLIQNPIDLLYFSGLELSAGKLLVLQDKAWLIVDGRYLESAKEISPYPVLLDKPSLLLELIPSGSTIGIDSEKMILQQYLDLSEALKAGNVHLVPEKGVVSALRAIKDKAEIELLKKASELGSLGFDYVVDHLQLGRSEKEMADELERFWKERGAKGVAFDPIIAFGANSSKPHYRADKERLKENQHVLIDIGVTLNHYHSDMTRVVFKGKKNPKIEEIFDIVAEAHLLAKKQAKSGQSIGALDEAARSYIASKGYGEQFSHSLGHGIGLEVHEYPTIRNTPELQKQKLETGMVITIEPGIYLPGIGGVRIEDTILIQDEGCESLTKRPF